MADYVTDLQAERDRLWAENQELMRVLRAIDAESVDLGRNGDIIVPSHVWDLISQHLS